MEKEFLEAYEKYADALFRYCYFRLSDEEKAKDVVQDTFLKTWDYIAQGKSITEMSAFLYRVARNCIVDQYRKRKTTSLDRLQEKGFEPRLDTRGRLETEIEAREVS